MRTLGDAYEAALLTAQRVGAEPAPLEARLLVAHGAGVTPERVFGFPETILNRAQREAVMQCLARRRSREPLSHILGTREFRGLSFEVGRDVLTPRPDSETLIEAALSWVGPERRHTPWRIVDFGTGSGCLLLALLNELTEARGVGIDISRPACKIAEKNAGRLGLSDRADFVHAGWQDWDGAPGDIIISNPPYIPRGDIASLEPEVRHFEPVRALDGGMDGLKAYRELAAIAKSALKPGGVAFFEVGIGQAHAVIGLLEEAGFAGFSVRRDLAGIERSVCAGMEPAS